MRLDHLNPCHEKFILGNGFTDRYIGSHPFFNFFQGASKASQAYPSLAASLLGRLALRGGAAWSRAKVVVVVGGEVVAVVLVVVVEVEVVVVVVGLWPKKSRPARLVVVGGEVVVVRGGCGG